MRRDAVSQSPHLNPRDLATIERVSQLRFVSGDQLRRLHFASGSDIAAEARAARRGLLRLTKLDYLARLPRRVGGVRAGSAGFVYVLGLEGQHLAMAHGWQPRRRVRRSRAPGTLFLNHALAISELHTQLVEADRAGRVELLTLAAEPACWRSSGPIGRQRSLTLKPDSFVRVGLGEFEFIYFVEVDRASEGSRALTTKLGVYLDYYDSGVEQAEHGVFPKVLWSVPDEDRAEVVRACIGSLPRARRELFAVSVFSRVMDAIATPEGAAEG
jgi:hypothetical protein